MKRRLVVGAAGHAQEVAWSLREAERALGDDCELLFFDDALPLGPLASGLGVIVGGIEAIGDYAAGGALVLGVGMPDIKRALVHRIQPLGLPWATVVHPRAVVGPNVQLGEGTYVAAGAVVTLNVRLGRFVTVNVHCQVAHDDVVGDFATLHPDAHLCGNVSIGEGVVVGAGAVAIPHVHIGDWAVLGAGCVAVHSLDGGVTYVGLPARPLGAAESPRLKSA